VRSTLPCVSGSETTRSKKWGRAVLARHSSLLVSKAQRGRRQNRGKRIAQDALHEVHFSVVAEDLNP
jgi:hypothetical protein